MSLCAGRIYKKQIILIILINNGDEAVLRTTLRQFEIFVAVVRCRGATAAASALGLTQAAVSMALADLEQLLDVRLFDRVGRRLALNDAGRRLYPKAAELVERAQELEQLLLPDRSAADLRLGASSTIGNYVLPRLMAAFLAEAPGSRFRLEVGNTWEVMEAVRRFEIDLGFVEGPCLDPDIETIAWRTDALAVCAAPDHPLARLPAVEPADLRRHGWILRERGSGTRDVVEQLLEAQLGTMPLTLELGDTEAIKRAVEAGMGISCLPMIALQEALERRTLVVLPTPFLRLSRRFHILLHRQKYRSEGVERFLAYCLAHAG